MRCEPIRTAAQWSIRERLSCSIFDPALKNRLLTYPSIRILSFLIAWVPWRLLHWKAIPLRILFQHVIRYRRKVIVSNLRRVWPQAEDKHRMIIRSCYQNLAMITLETFKSHTAPIDQIHQYCRVENPEVVEAFFKQGRSVLIAANHYRNFELAALTIPGALSAPVIGIWKPFRNKRVSRFVHDRRTRGGMQLIPQLNAIKTLIDLDREGPNAYFFLADQSPSNQDKAHWVSFLGQDTAFIPGPEVLARRLDIPVIYAVMRRASTGRGYTIRLEVLTEQPATLPETEITRRYAAMIEADILHDPGGWLWTHKRWKKNRSHPEA